MGSRRYTVDSRYWAEVGKRKVDGRRHSDNWTRVLGGWLRAVLFSTLQDSQYMGNPLGEFIYRFRFLS